MRPKNVIIISQAARTRPACPQVRVRRLVGTLLRGVPLLVQRAAPRMRMHADPDGSMVITDNVSTGDVNTDGR